MKPHSGTDKRLSERLVKETLAGRTESFERLISLNEGRVKAVGASFFRNPDDVEDFVQEVFIKAYTSLPQFRGESRFSTWLTRIAYTTALNAKARSKNYESIADETEIAYKGRTPEENHLYRTTILAVREALKDLPENQKICLDLYFFHDFSYEEISIITTFPINTIKSHVFRAKKILRERLQDFVRS